MTQTKVREPEIEVGFGEHLKPNFMEVTISKYIAGDWKIVLSDVRHGVHTDEADKLAKTEHMFKEIVTQLKPGMKLRFTFSEEDFALMQHKIAGWLEGFTYDGDVD